MALTSAECQLIDDASPINNDFSIGDRLKYMTTGGAYDDGTCSLSAGTLSSATLSQCDLASGYHNDVSIQSLEWQDWNANVCSLSTTTGVTKITSGGHYKWSSTAGSIVRVATNVPDDDMVWIMNIATGGGGGSSGQISLCTDKSVYYGTSTAYNAIILSGGRTLIMQKNSTRWLSFQATANFALMTSDSSDS